MRNDDQLMENKKKGSVLSATNLSKRFGSREVLTNINLDIYPGDILALLGSNGAGKTTFISIAVGLRKPTSGSIELFDRNPAIPVNRRRVGIALQDAGFLDSLTLRETINFVGAHFPDPLDTAELLSRFELEKYIDRQIGALSGGQKRRLSVVAALVGQPDFLVLDEPTAGLDLEGRLQLWEEVRYFQRKGGAILLTTHYMEEVEALASRAVLISHGRIKAEGRPEEIKTQAGFTENASLQEVILKLDTKLGS